jgi:hypothetical protein
MLIYLIEDYFDLRNGKPLRGKMKNYVSIARKEETEKNRMGLVELGLNLDDLEEVEEGGSEEPGYKFDPSYIDLEWSDSEDEDRENRDSEDGDSGSEDGDSDSEDSEDGDGDSEGGYGESGCGELECGERGCGERECRQV